jgi:hypothetical protein
MPERFQASAAEQKSAIWQCGEAQREATASRAGRGCSARAVVIFSWRFSEVSRRMMNNIIVAAYLGTAIHVLDNLTAESMPVRKRLLDMRWTLISLI